MSVNVMCTRAWEGCHFLTSKNTQFLASSKVTRVSIKQVQFPYSQQLTYTVHTDTGHVPSSFVRDARKCFAKVEYFQLTRKRQICAICITLIASFARTLEFACIRNLYIICPHKKIVFAFWSERTIKGAVNNSGVDFGLGAQNVDKH